MNKLRCAYVKKNRKRKKVKSQQQSSTVDDMVDCAASHLEQFQLDEARLLLNQALEKDENNVRALDLSAGVFLEIGDMDAARNVLTKLISLQPDVGYSKYLSLAQISHGMEAHDLYMKGVDILLAVDNKDESTTRQLSSCYCSLCELFMTDLCDEDDAQQRCIDFIERAVETDPANPECHQTHADYLLVTGDVEGASAALRRCTDLWLPQYQAAREGTAAAADPLEVCPVSYDSRLSCVRSLIECQVWHTAVDILDGLTEEDDQHTDVWYLLGLINYERGEEYYNNSRYYLRRAQKVSANSDSDDEEVLQHISQLLDSMGPGDVESDEETEEGHAIGDESSENEDMEH